MPDHLGGLTAHWKVHRYCAPQTMQRNATPYARGKVSHPDHATILLRGRHRVVGNLETIPEPMAFLDLLLTLSAPRQNGRRQLHELCCSCADLSASWHCPFRQA
jgi:hypothetical protein